MHEILKYEKKNILMEKIRVNNIAKPQQCLENLV